MKPTMDWIILASKFVPENRQDWLKAMLAECQNIDDPAARQKFARGCFIAVLGEWTRTRRGLSLLGRLGGAACLILLGVFGLLSARNMGLNPEQDLSGYARIISMLCVAYMGAGLLVLMSLRATRYLALGGCLLASAAFLYVQLAAPVIVGVNQAFLSAVSLETAGLMAGLFLACLYLSWVYDPDHMTV